MKELRMKKIILSAIALSVMNLAMASSKTTVDDTQGYMGQALKIKVHHEFNVYNDSSITKNYLVAETCEVDGKKYKKGWGFILPSHGRKSFGEDLYLDYSAITKGEWKIEAMTSIANSDSVSFGHAKLTVN